MFGRRKTLSYQKNASIGLGAMIVFIAMVLVAGISASVFIQTAGYVEGKSMETGQQTTAEVATGLKVTDIEGHYSLRSIAYNDSSGVIWRMENDSWADRETVGSECLMWNNCSRIHNITMSITPNPGSQGIDLSNALIEISNSSAKCLLSFGNNSAFAASVSGSGVFACDVFNLDPDEFGIIVLEDADSSINSITPVLNRGDRVMLTINASACFQGIPTSIDVWGNIIIEEGSIARFEFSTPATFQDTVYDLF